MFFLSFLMACTGAKKIGISYQLSKPSFHWQPIPQSAADYAWRSPSQYATIYAKSNCGSYFEDRSLEDSILSLTRGLHVSNPITQETIRISNRKGVFQVMDSELDGIPIRLGMLVVSKNNCLYDFLLIAPKKFFADSVADFLNMAQSLNTSPEPNR